jgi:hypothetical protein
MSVNVARKRSPCVDSNTVISEDLAPYVSIMEEESKQNVWV